MSIDKRSSDMTPGSDIWFMVTGYDGSARAGWLAEYMRYLNRRGSANYSEDDISAASKSDAATMAGK